MNNPVRIQFMDGNVTKYIYSAAGEKLRVIYITAVPNISVPIGSIKELSPSEILCKDSIDYLLGGNLTLRNGRIDKYLFEEGYCQAEAYSSTKDQFTFCYYDRDHLGSVRQVTEADGSKNGYVIQTANYYPFGGEFCHGDAKNSIQSHKYNGKEFDNMYGLNTYDYGARQYNPVTGRLDRMDPLCEKYYPTSPFAYCANNPVRLIDPDGRDPGDFFYSLDAAAKDFGKYTNPKSIENNREYATSFYKMTNNKGEKGFSYTKPRQGSPDGVSSWKFISRDKKGNVKDSKSPTKEKAVATGHTHGAYIEKLGLGNDVFSGLQTLDKKNVKDPNRRKEITDNTKDIGSSNVAGIPDYLATPAGTLQYYDPSTGEVKIKSTEMPCDKNDTIKKEDIISYYNE